MRSASKKPLVFRLLVYFRSSLTTHVYIVTDTQTLKDRAHFGSHCVNDLIRTVEMQWLCSSRVPAQRRCGPADGLLSSLLVVQVGGILDRTLRYKDDASASWCEAGATCNCLQLL